MTCLIAGGIRIAPHIRQEGEPRLKEVPFMDFRIGSTRGQRVSLTLVRVAGACAVITVLAVAGASPARAQQNAVADWNAIASQAFVPTQGTNPLGQSRTYAMLHAAVHDVVNAIHPRYQLYTKGLTADPDASIDAAVAAASRDVLVALVPHQQPLIDAAYASALAAVPDGPAKTAGIAAGQASASATLRRRQLDGTSRATQPLYVPKQAPGDYQFTAPFDLALFPGWRHITPFAIDLSEHRLRGPLALPDALYARDFNEVRKVGRAVSTTRTAEQPEIARFWYEDSPLGWNRIATTVVRTVGLDMWDAARVLALMNFAMADGFIAGFDAKYHYRFWRPITAIHDAARDGNRFTQADATWEPLLTTPPVPDYPSTHTVLGAAAAEVLIYAFGDTVPYSATSLTLPGVKRQFTGFSQAARENGHSRIYAGIHFRRAVEDGYKQGQGIGRAVVALLPPVD